MWSNDVGLPMTLHMGEEISIDRSGNVNFADTTNVACLPDKVTKHFVTMQADAVTFALVTAYILQAAILMISIPLRIIERIIEEEREFRDGFVARSRQI